MKIAIAETSSEENAQVAMQGARAPYYLLIDTESGISEALRNPAAQFERGAGPQAAAFLIGRGIDKVVAEDFGPKFRTDLENGNIVCEEKTGAVSEVVTKLGNQV
jgi:predicted Fe-Mo cluster-binding NifX family protein